MELAVAVPSLVRLVQGVAACGVDNAFFGVVAVEDLGSPVDEEDVAAAAPPALPVFPGVAVVTNAEAGRPPKVSASPAFSAYGTLTSKILSCSGCCPT